VSADDFRLGFNRATALILVLALLGGLGGILAARWTMTPQGRPPPPGTPMLAIGDLRADVVLPDLAGVEQRLSQWDGRPLLLNFWASWCGPCIEEMPLLDDLHNAESARDGLVVVGIALDTPEPVAGFVEQLGVQYPILIAEPGRVDVSTTFGNDRSVLPYSVLVGRDGRIMKQKFGSFTEASLRKWVAEAL
jgi:thiol-disulfide isomerase/thioredoxin